MNNILIIIKSPFFSFAAFSESYTKNHNQLKIPNLNWLVSHYLVFSTGKKRETRLSLIIRTIKETSYKWIQAFWTSQLQNSANQIGSGVVYGSMGLD